MAYRKASVGMNPVSRTPDNELDGNMSRNAHTDMSHYSKPPLSASDTQLVKQRMRHGSVGNTVDHSIASRYDMTVGANETKDQVDLTAIEMPETPEPEQPASPLSLLIAVLTLVSGTQILAGMFRAFDCRPLHIMLPYGSQ